MKNAIKIVVTICILVLSVNVFAQDFLGKNYDDVIKILNTNGSKFRAEKLDNDRSSITQYSKYDKELTETSYFFKKGKKMICEQIDISSPKDYYGPIFWEGKELILKQGYEKTDYVYSFMGMEDLTVYKSLDKWFKSTHYMTAYFIDKDLIALTYYLDTSSFKGK